jgi:hypothetical protein
MHRLRVEGPMKLVVILLAALLVGGCGESLQQKILTGPVITLTLKDAVSAQDVLTKSAALLPAGDTWLGCMQTIQGLLQAVQAGPGAPEPVNGILTEAARLHVLDTMLQQSTSTPGQQNCAQILIQIQLRAAAGAIPGGALLPLR